MPRTEIEVVTRMLDQAYRTDPWSALRKNLASVKPEEWDVRPAEHSVDEFGTQPELSICDIALHTGAKYMYYDRSFGDMKLEWGDIPGPPSRSMDDVLAWLEPGTDEAGLFTFDSALVEATPVGPVAPDLLDRFERMQPYGKTSLFDAIAETGRRVASAGGSRRAVVVLTDGMDNASRLSPAEVSSLASSIDVPVYVVLVVPENDRTGSAEELDERLTAEREGELGDLARWTGGEIFAAVGPASSSLAARQIVEELRHQYLVSFEPGDRPGWHPIVLTTTRKNVVVRSTTPPTSIRRWTLRAPAIALRQQGGLLQFQRLPHVGVLRAEHERQDVRRTPR